MLCGVAGSFELALAQSGLAESGRYDAIACLGCVLRGEDPTLTTCGQRERIGRIELDTAYPSLSRNHRRHSSAGGRARGVAPRNQGIRRP